MNHSPSPFFYTCDLVDHTLLIQRSRRSPSSLFQVALSTLSLPLVACPHAGMIACCGPYWIQRLQVGWVAYCCFQYRGTDFGPFPEFLSYSRTLSHCSLLFSPAFSMYDITGTGNLKTITLEVESSDTIDIVLTKVQEKELWVILSHFRSLIADLTWSRIPPDQ